MSSLKLPSLVHVLYVPISPLALCLGPKALSFFLLLTFLLHYTYKTRKMLCCISDYVNYSVS